MKNKIIAFTLAVLGVAVIGVTQLPAKAAVDSTRDCDKFAVVYCGTMTPGEARNKYGQKDHAKIFQAMGISRADLNGSFKNGVVHQDGRVVVNGKTVATGAMTAARHLGGTPIAGTNAGKVPVSKMGSAQTAMVKFDKNGRFLFAIMKPCGNPVTATPPKPEPKPKAECKSLVEEKISDNRRRYTANATLKNGAKVKSYTFVATKNGKQVDKKVVTSSKKTATYNLTTSGPGKYKVKVTIQTTVGAKTGNQCSKSFTVPTPPVPPTPKQPGVVVEKYVDTDKKYKRVGVNIEYDYQIRVINTGKVVLKNVKVSDTPDQGVSLLSVAPNVGTISDNTWTYTIATLGIGETLTYTLTAKVPEYLAGKLVNTVCVDAPEVPGGPDDCDDAEVDVPPVPGKIEVCELETRKVISINEADFDSTKHSRDLSDCEAPEELPQTGPIETIFQIIGAMSLASASAYYAVSRRAV